MLSLAFWIGQGIYSRAIYATGNTFAPMIQSTPGDGDQHSALRLFSKVVWGCGLAWASNAAILLQTISLALLLRWKGMLQIDRGRWLEIARSIFAGFAAWAGAWAVIGRIEWLTTDGRLAQLKLEL